MRAELQLIDRRLTDLEILRTSPIAVACSGGPDSVGLAAALHQLGRGPAVLLHVDHGLQSPTNSRRERRAVDLAAQRLAVPLVHLAAPRGAIGREAAGGPDRSGGVEARARSWRFRLLAAWVRDVGWEQYGGRLVVALGHHRGDAAETVVWRIAAGGVVDPSLPVERRIGGVRFVRPAIDVPRAGLRALSAGMATHCDPSNRDTALRRVAVRRTVMPTLERVQPGAERRLAAHGATVAALVAAVTRSLRSVPISTDAAGRARVAHAAFRSRLPIERELIVREMVRRAAGSTRVPVAPFTSLIRSGDPDGSSAHGIAAWATKGELVIGRQVVRGRFGGYLHLCRGASTIAIDLAEQRVSVRPGVSGPTVTTVTTGDTIHVAIRSVRADDVVTVDGRRRPVASLVASLDLSAVARMLTPVVEGRSGIVAVLPPTRDPIVADAEPLRADAPVRQWRLAHEVLDSQ